VDEDDLPGTGAIGHVERLLRGQVTASRVVELGARQRCLGHHEICTAGGRHEPLVRARVARDRDARSRRIGDLAAPRRHVVLARDELERQVAHVEPVGRVVLDHAVGVVEEVGPLADRDREGVQPLLAARREEDRDVGAGDALPRQQVAERDEVDEVIERRVQGADAEVGLSVRLLKLATRLPAVDQDGRRPISTRSPMRSLGLRL
jgi:hypothetical protein